MRRAPSIVLVFAFVLPTVLAGCSGNAVVEPAQLTSKRAKAFLAKCQPAPPPDEIDLKLVYACIPAEDACPDGKAEETKAELGYVLDKGGACGTTVKVYDVPCGPDLNAIECCYGVRIQSSQPICD
jgi:hypothetical protein